MSGVATVSLVGAGLSASAGKSASKDAAKAQEQQLAAQQANLQFQQQQFGWAKGFADPSLRRLSAEAASDQPLDYALMAAQIKRNYANQARNLTGLGYGRMAGFGSAMRGLRLGQASDLSQAFAEGLSKRRGLQQWLGGTMGGAAMGQAGQVGQAYGGLGNVYGQQAQQAYGAAQAGWQGAAQGVMGAAQALGEYFNRKKEPLEAVYTPPPKDTPPLQDRTRVDFSNIPTIYQPTQQRYWSKVNLGSPYSWSK